MCTSCHSVPTSVLVTPRFFTSDATRSCASSEYAGPLSDATQAACISSSTNFPLLLLRPSTCRHSRPLIFPPPISGHLASASDKVHLCLKAARSVTGRAPGTATPTHEPAPLSCARLPSLRTPVAAAPASAVPPGGVFMVLLPSLSTPWFLLLALAPTHEALRNGPSGSGLGLSGAAQTNRCC